MESTETYATMFWKRDQKASETEEAYAAELKHIYGKAYPQHDCSAQDEDMLHRFLNGLLHQKAQQQTDFVKDPASIDDALDEVARYKKLTSQVTWQKRALDDIMHELPI